MIRRSLYNKQREFQTGVNDNWNKRVTWTRNNTNEYAPNTTHRRYLTALYWEYLHNHNLNIGTKTKPPFVAITPHLHLSRGQQCCISPPQDLCHLPKILPASLLPLHLPSHFPRLPRTPKWFENWSMFQYIRVTQPLYSPIRGLLGVHIL